MMAASLVKEDRRARRTPPHDHRASALERREKRAKLATRLRAVILAMRGHDAPSIAAMLGRSRRAVQDWVRWYNREGIEGLPDAPRPGQPPKLSKEQEQRLCAWLDQGPGPDGPSCARRGPEVRAYIEDNLGVGIYVSGSESTFGVGFSVSGSYDLLHRLGYSALRPRSRHYKADGAAQEQFKKDAPLLWTGCGVISPARSSRSGTRTRRVWVSRAR
jgi:transposase